MLKMIVRTLRELHSLSHGPSKLNPYKGCCCELGCFITQWLYSCLKGSLYLHVYFTCLTRLRYLYIALEPLRNNSSSRWALSALVLKFNVRPNNYLCTGSKLSHFTLHLKHYLFPSYYPCVMLLIGNIYQTRKRKGTNIYTLYHNYQNTAM